MPISVWGQSSTLGAYFQPRWGHRPNHCPPGDKRTASRLQRPASRFRVLVYNPTVFWIGRFVNSEFVESIGCGDRSCRVYELHVRGPFQQFADTGLAHLMLSGRNIQNPCPGPSPPTELTLWLLTKLIQQSNDLLPSAALSALHTVHVYGSPSKPQDNPAHSIRDLPHQHSLDFASHLVLNARKHVKVPFQCE